MTEPNKSTANSLQPLSLNLSKAQRVSGAPPSPFSATAPTARRSNSPTRSYSRDMPSESTVAMAAAALGTTRRGQSPSLSRNNTATFPIRSYSEENLADEVNSRDPNHHSVLLTARGPSPGGSSSSPTLRGLNMRLDTSNLDATIGPSSASAPTARGPTPSRGALVTSGGTPSADMVASTTSLGERFANYLPAALRSPGSTAKPAIQEEIDQDDNQPPPAFTLDDCPNIADLLESSPAGLVTKTHRPPSPSTTVKHMSPQRVQATPQRKPQSPQFTPSLLSPAASRPPTPSTKAVLKTGREPTEMWVSQEPHAAPKGNMDATADVTPKNELSKPPTPKLATTASGHQPAPGSPSTSKPLGSFANTAAQLIRSRMSPARSLFPPSPGLKNGETESPSDSAASEVNSSPKGKKTPSPKLINVDDKSAASGGASTPSLSTISKLVSLFDPLDIASNLTKDPLLSSDFLLKMGSSSANNAALKEAQELEEKKKQEAELQKQLEADDARRRAAEEKKMAEKKRGKLLNLITTATADTASLPISITPRSPLSPQGTEAFSEHNSFERSSEPTTTVEVVNEALERGESHGLTESLISEINDAQRQASQQDKATFPSAAPLPTDPDAPHRKEEKSVDNDENAKIPKDKEGKEEDKKAGNKFSASAEALHEGRADDALIAELVAAAANGVSSVPPVINAATIGGGSSSTAEKGTNSLSTPPAASAPIQSEVPARKAPATTSTFVSNSQIAPHISTAQQKTSTSSTAKESTPDPSQLTEPLTGQQQKRNKVPWSPGFRDYVCGTLSGIGKVVAGYPFDSLKGRVQGGDFGGSVRRAFVETIRYEGIATFYQGVTLPAVNVCFVGGILFYVNGAIRNYQQPDGIEPFTYSQMFVAGCGGGAAVGICIVPVEVLKVRMQLLNKVEAEEAQSLVTAAAKKRAAELRAAKGTSIPAFQTTAELVAASQRKAKKALHGPSVSTISNSRSAATGTSSNSTTSATRPIINNIRSIALSLRPVDFFAGITPTLIRECGTFGIFFPVNEYLKRKIALRRDKLDLEMVAKRQAEQKKARLYGLTEGRFGPDDIVIPQPCFTTRVLAAGLAGMICWLPVYPADQIKTKMQLNPAMKYKSWLHCGAEIVRNEGIKVGLFKGLAPCLVRAFPAYAAQFLLFEKLTERWRV